MDAVSVGTWGPFRWASNNLLRWMVDTRSSIDSVCIPILFEETAVQQVDTAILNLEQVWLSASVSPASVQRDYKWTTAQARQLLDDLTRHAGIPEQEDTPADTPLTDYFLGSIILRREGPWLIVYDGLQRLTTVTALFAVLRDYIDSPRLKQRLHACLVEANGEPRLDLPNCDPALNEELIPRGEAGKRRYRPLVNDAAIRLRFVASEFRKRLSPLPQWYLERLAEMLLLCVHVIVIEVGDRDLARQIFVTTNARGLPLNEAEIFKGQLLALAGDAGQRQYITEIWNRMLASDKHFGEFLEHIDFLARSEPYTQGNLLRLADYLSSVFTDTPNRLTAWMVEVEELHACWTNITLEQPLRDRALEGAIRHLHNFRWPGWQAIALLFLRDYYRSEDEARARPVLLRRLSGLSRRCMAIQLAQFEPVEIARIFGHAVGEFSRKTPVNPINSSLRLKFPQIRRLKSYLIRDQLDHQDQFDLLKWLEQDMTGRFDHLEQNLSVEHVLPRNPGPDSNWIARFPDDETRLTATYSLGNVALIPRQLNELMENTSFGAKKEAVETAPAELKLDAFQLIPSIFENGDWNYGLIIDRAEWLRDEIFKRLDLGEDQDFVP